MPKRNGLAVAGLCAAIIAVYLAIRLLGPGPTNEREARRLAAEARAKRADKKLDEAIALYRAAVARAPGDVEVNREYQGAMREAGRLPEVRAEYERRAAVRPQDPLSLYLAARVQEKDDQVEAGMRRILELSPGYPLALKALGHLLASSRPDEAARHLAVVARSAHATMDDLQALIVLAHRRGDLDSVGEWLRRWREIADGADPQHWRFVPLVRDGDRRSVIMVLNECRGAAVYQLYISHEAHGTRTIGIKRTESGRWAQVESPEWTPFGRPGVSLQEFMDAAEGSLDEEPDYPQVFGRAMRHYRQDE